jgi:hypothetical protein
MMRLDILVTRVDIELYAANENLLLTESNA